jgi:hypothetical protein
MRGRPPRFAFSLSPAPLLCYTGAMSTTHRIASAWLPALAGMVLLAVLGCESGPTDRDDEPRPRDKEKPVEARKVLVAPNIFLEVQGTRRRVLVSASVCLREGPLEQLLCRKNTKEHEAILTADIDARKLHEALLLAGATEGSPVRFRPRYRPATGSTIKISLTYEEKGQQKTIPAQQWVKNLKTGKPLDSDWVFAGSRLVDNPLDPGKPKLYLANDGDVICISNFETALLDLPIESSKDDADRGYAAFTERIPPLETKVVVTLEPVPDAKKAR